ncbi:MAG: PAS domain S-box protein [Desulfuromonadales bacterium]
MGILERRQTDDAVTCAKKDWERTFDAVPDLISIIDINQTILRANKAMADRCGLALKDLVGRKCYETVHGLHAAPDCCPRFGMIQNGLVHNKEIEDKRLNGIFDVTVSPLLDENGQINAYVHVMRDISERKKVEETLRKSEEKFRTVADHTFDWEYWKAVDGSLAYVSPACERISEYTAEEFQHDPDLLIKIIHPDDIDKFMHHLELDNGITSEVCQTPDFRIRTRSGQERWIEHICQEVFDKDGMSLGRRACNRNITERKQAEKERIQLEQQFHHAQKLESLGVLAGGIAHDLNNILTVILGHCYMAKEDFIPEQEYKAAFQKVESASNRAADLCRQMLAYAGKSQSVQTRIDVWSLVDEVAKMLQAAIKKNVSVRLDLNRDVPAIKGDAGQIQQIVMNLVINSAEAIGDVSGSIGIQLRETIYEVNQTDTDVFGTIIKAGRYACLEVADTGIGMDEETQKRIFEPFYSTKFTGRGLGMSAIQGIIKSHEGMLLLTSSPGAGTTFKVLFPLSEAFDGFVTAPARLTPFKKTGGTILLVDDELELQNIGATVLKSMGFKALTARDGCEALEIFCEHRRGDIDLILLDLIMPVMGGMDTYHELRKTDTTIPIVICSGYGVESVTHVINNDQHAGFVHKPYKPDELRNVIVSMMG